MSAGASSQTLWENFCIHVVQLVIEKMPDVVEHGIAIGDLKYPPLKNLSLPSLANHDTGLLFTGFCGLGANDIGNGILDVTSLTLNGLDTIAVTSGQAVTFTKPETELTAPITFGALTVSGRWAMRHRCQARKDPKAAWWLSISGSFEATLQAASIVIVLGGLDDNAGTAGSVTLTWSDPQHPPMPAITPTFDPDSPSMAQQLLQNYLDAGDNEIACEVTDNLTKLLNGDATYQGKTLAGELLAVINDGLARAASGN
jgi:hypothetical protein